jgi:coenzyme F420-reducing hydrogenase delta subunit
LLSYVGINPDRLYLDWVSSAEAPKFAKVTTSFVETIRELGSINDEIGTQLAVGEMEKVRV